MCWAGPGFPWKQAQDVAADEASSLLPGDWMKRQQQLWHRGRVGQWPSALGLLMPVTGQALLGMDTHLLPTPCGMTSHKVFTAWLAPAPNGNNPKVHLQGLVGSARICPDSRVFWGPREAGDAGVQSTDLGAWQPRPESWLCQSLSCGRCFTTPCLSFPTHRTEMMRIMALAHRITSPHDPRRACGTLASIY